MNKRLYSLRDDKMASYEAPFIADNDSVVVRMFGDAISGADKNTPLKLHPADFTLWFIGLFDAETGSLSVPESGAYIVSRGSDFISEN